MYIIVVAAICLINSVASQPGKCDQTPPGAIGGPSKSDGTFTLSVVSKSGPNNVFLPDQTYILILSTSNLNRSFTSFMITAEDPDVDNSEFIDPVDVGNLKTLDTDLKSRYSERCFNTIENTDYSDKYKIEIHWVSPKTRSVKKVRIRASVGENAEAWYGGEELTVVLYKDNSTPQDSPPLLPTRECNLCSEARYEVIFRGLWSRVSHPSHYPNKPDTNSYSHMIGASHAYDHVIWKQGVLASDGLRLLAETGEVGLIEREIIQNMSETGGTRTLIRGRRRRHPEMFQPSHSLFRVDRVHHLFSIAVAMRPSPDWFLGTSMYELCTEDGWLQPGKKIPLYPWDAGTMDGISYESPTSTTTPQVPVERVAVGSFDPMSPFYQLNLNDLHAFAELEVNRLEVFPLENCDSPEGEPSQGEENKEYEESQAEEPLVAESTLLETIDKCKGSVWGQWSECTPLDGVCGPGKQLRTGHVPDNSETIYSHMNKNNDVDGGFERCIQNGDSIIQEQNCHVPC